VSCSEFPQKRGAVDETTVSVLEIQNGERRKQNWRENTADCIAERRGRLHRNKHVDGERERHCTNGQPKQCQQSKDIPHEHGNAAAPMFLH
jgi:hypothetical protein